MIEFFKNMIMLASYNIPDSLKNSSANTISKWFNFNQPSGHAVIEFYQVWRKSGYLIYNNVFAIKFAGFLKEIFLIFFYNIAHGMEQIFDSILSLFGIFNNFGSGPFATLRTTIFGLGIGFLFLSLTVLSINSIWGKGDKYIKGLKSAVMFTAVVIILPFIVSSIGNITKSGADAIGHSNSTKSMALEPINDNIIDVLNLANKDFDQNPTKLNPNDFNDFTDDNIGSVDFGEVVAKDNIKLVDAKKHPGGSKVFNFAQSGKDLTEHDLPKNNDSGVRNAFSGGYARYTGQFFIATITEIILALVLVVMSFRVVKSVYQIVITTIAAPLVFYSNLQRPSRIKELLSSISGAMISIWSEMISIQVFFILVRDLGNNPAVKELRNIGGGPFQLGILKVILLLGSFVGFIFGVQLIERWTGVQNGTGHGMLGFLLGGAMAGKALTGIPGAVKGAAGAAKGTAQAAASLGSKAKHGVGNGIQALSSNDSSVNPAAKVGNNQSSDKNKKNDKSDLTKGINSNDGNAKLNGKDNKGTDEASINAGEELNNGVNPTDGVGDDSKGTDQAAINDGENRNGVNPTAGVGDDSKGTDQAAINDGENRNEVNPTTGVGDDSKGTDQAAINDGENRDGVNPTIGVGNDSEGTSQDAINNNRINTTSRVSSAGKSGNHTQANGSTQNSLGRGLNQKLDAINPGDKKVKLNPAEQILSDKMDNITKQTEANAKASRPKFGDKLQDTANSLSRIQQETDKPSINPPSDDDEF